MPNRAPDRHSRLVGWLKVALPLFALAILASLFLVTRRVDPGSQLTLSEAELADRLREPRLSEPAFAGVTRDGARISVTAREARPAGTAPASAAEVRAEMITPDAARLTLTAGALRYLADGQELELSGDVLVSHSLGYEFRTGSFMLALDRSGGESGGAVEGFGPPGQITAGRMEIRATEPGDTSPAGYLLVFNEGVRLIYLPQPSPATRP